MKRILVLFVFLLFSGEIFSQDLEGEWKGYFRIYTYKPNEKFFISLFIVKLNDSTYHGKSTTIRGIKIQDTAICSIEINLQKGNITIIEEKEIIKSYRFSAEDSALAFLKRPICLQKMKLKYKNKELRGNWTSDDEACGNGPIILFKKE